MQFVNDDMDDMYRQAAEEYPLKTDSGDWNKVLEKMQSDGKEKIPERKVRRRYFLLLVLIPLLLICTTYINNDSFKNATSAPLGNKTAIENQPLPGVEGKLNPVSDKKLVEIYQPKDRQTPASSHITTDVTKKDFERIDNSKQPDRAKDKIIDSEVPAISNQFNESGKTKGPKDLISNKSAENINEPPVASTSADQNSPAPATDKNVIDNQPKETAAIPVVEKKKEKKDKKPANKFYVGFQAGPDFSMVKSSNIEGVGYGFGLVIGYNISKKIAVESGVLWDHKKYVSEGQHFKTDNINWPHVTIYDLSGYCEMFEIPLNIRYNISANSRRTWFANAGLSSYIMKTENYDYYYERYGVYQTGNKEYKNTTTNWLSIVHLSVGLEKKLGAIGDLRIEPYVKLPVNGVGIGSMPLRSTGIYLGITRPIR